MTRTYANQFGPEYTPPASILRLLEAGHLIDQSWGNDTSPSFGMTYGGNTLLLFVDAERHADREMGHGRFAFYDYTLGSANESDYVYSTESENDALCAIKCFLASGVIPQDNN